MEMTDWRTAYCRDCAYFSPSDSTCNIAPVLDNHTEPTSVCECWEEKKDE